MNLATVTGKLATVGGPKAQLLVGKASKYSPQILTAVGLLGGGTSIIMIAKATLKLEDLVDNHEMGKAIIEEKAANGDYKSERDRKKDIRYLYVRSGLDLAKIYGPGVSLALASGLCIVGAQGIQQKRQVAMVAALKSAESALQAYRQRVIEAIGEEKEADIRYGVSVDTEEDETGKKVKIRTFNANGLPDHMVLFDSSNKNWQKGNRELNLLFLKNMQNWANDRLNSRGYVYLNEVFSWMGFPEVPAGQVVGWLHKDFDNGDGYIDFGWDNPANRSNVQRFLNGEEEGILLDLNIDGEINSKL